MPAAAVIPATNIEEAAAILLGGGVIVMPTDTVYGLAALPGDQQAIHKLFRAMRRSVETALPVLIADVADLSRVAAAVPVPAKRLAANFWPGPLTLVLRRSPNFRGAGSVSDETVAVRVPDHDGARALIRAVGGALTVTAAAVAGKNAATTAADAATQLGRGVDLILDGGACAGGAVSSVVDCSRDRMRLVREGALTRDQLTRAALSRIG